MYPRWIADNLKNALDNRRIVIVSGARQTGKTTLTEQMKGPGFEFRNGSLTICLKRNSLIPELFYIPETEQ